MLYDRACIYIEAGNGGAGAVSFRREALVPRGGPDGGDGGRGGDVVVVCKGSLRDLRGLRQRRHFRAGNGAAGAGAGRHGAAGAPLTLPLPPGTVVEGAEGDLAGRRIELLADGQRAVLARGGAGGRGNRHFAGAARRAPRFAERGLPGERGWVTVQLKLLADVGLVGLPNAGKSSLLAALTRAKPKVAPYPFTTLEPVLGVLETEERQLVLADIPGLIEGASKGAGLGDRFLAHVERTALLVHVLDLAPALGEGEGDPLSLLATNYRTVERELAAYNPRLSSLPRLLALSKADLVDGEHLARTSKFLAKESGLPAERIVAVSSATGFGLKRLKAAVFAHHQPPPATAPPAAPPQTPVELGRDDLRFLYGPAAAALPAPPPSSSYRLYRPRGLPVVEVERCGERTFVLKGAPAEQLALRFDLADPEARAYVERRLRRWGALGALQANGYRPGDRVVLAERELLLVPVEGKGRR